MVVWIQEDGQLHLETVCFFSKYKNLCGYELPLTPTIHNQPKSKVSNASLGNATSNINESLVICPIICIRYIHPYRSCELLRDDTQRSFIEIILNIQNDTNLTMMPIEIRQHPNKLK
jgi:hypothetical protein